MNNLHNQLRARKAGLLSGVSRRQRKEAPRTQEAKPVRVRRDAAPAQVSAESVYLLYRRAIRGLEFSETPLGAFMGAA